MLPTIPLSGFSCLFLAGSVLPFCLCWRAEHWLHQRVFKAFHFTNKSKEPSNQIATLKQVDIFNGAFIFVHFDCVHNLKKFYVYHSSTILSTVYGKSRSFFRENNYNSKSGCCYITIDAEMHTHQNGNWSYKLSLHRKTKIIQNITNNIKFVVLYFFIVQPLWNKLISYMEN
jgi:hypothetical protein